MRTSALVVAVAVAACGGDPPPPADPDAAIPDAAILVPVTCVTADGLRRCVEVRDSTGQCTICALGGADVFVVSIVGNPGAAPATFVTESPCLITLIVARNLDDGMEGGAQECGGTQTSWTVPPGESVEQIDSLTTLMFGLPTPGRHEVTVVFDEPRATRVSHTFAVID